MKTHLRYLWYVLRHKWFVFVECVRLGIPYGTHHWYGAGRANGAQKAGNDRYAEVRVWYSKRSDSIRLHPTTRLAVEHMIGLR